MWQDLTSGVKEPAAPPAGAAASGVEWTHAPTVQDLLASAQTPDELAEERSARWQPSLDAAAALDRQLDERDAYLMVPKDGEEAVAARNKRWNPSVEAARAVDRRMDEVDKILAS